MNNRKRFGAWFKPCHIWLGVAALLLLAGGCSSGSESLSASGGVGGSGVTVGEVSDYGSIFVNGLELDTTQTEIYVEDALAGTGDQAALSHLPIGQRVVVQGDISDDRNGTALRVDAFYYVQGPVWQVEQLDAQTVSLDVMGQTVYVDPQTTLAGVTLTTLAQDMVLQVSGTLDALGAIHAGYIALAAESMTPDRTVAVKGLIQNLNSAEDRFQINDLIVDYSQVQDAAELLTEDGSIAVQGTLNDNVLIATALRRFETELFDSVENFSVDGFITADAGGGQWRMGPYRIRIDAATGFEGMDPEDLTTGVRIVVQGRLQARLLEAHRVKVTSRVRMESNVAAVDVDNRTVTLDGMAGIFIRLNILTHIHGGALTLAGIAPGDHVRVFGQYREDGSVVAVDLFENLTDAQDARFILQGPVTEVAAPAFYLMGTEILTDANEDIDFYYVDSASLTADEYLSALAVGSLTRVTGRWENTQLLYETMAIIR
ncbi:MAG: hypothetical protein HZB24_03600 [Desulfobacterales bacterium]|nr:hypothetical protein [Desulfobacterales bacterium]